MTTINRYEYGRAWNYKLWNMKPISEDVARKRFKSENEDDWFSVAAFAEAVPSDGIPEFVIEILPRAEFMGVHFYDQSRSLRFVYGFRKHGDAMFREEITEYTYPDDGIQHRRNESTVTEMLRYYPDGRVHQRKDVKSMPTVETADYRGVDVSSHWEPIPEFGEWESIARFDREKPDTV